MVESLALLLLFRRYRIRSSVRTSAILIEVFRDPFKVSRQLAGMAY